MATIILTGSDAVAGLTTTDLVPPPRPPQLVTGSTAELRDAMARFAGADDHPPRRAAVVAAVALFDVAQVERSAQGCMTECLDGAAVDILAAAWRVPSYTLATVLGFGNEREQVRADAEQLARVIGRGEPADSASDQATDRLLRLFGDFDDPVALASIFYQNHDATAGLLSTSTFQAYSGTADVPPPATTTRVATSSIQIAEHEIPDGADVTIVLEDLTFGAGHHQCPGQQLAEAIVSGAIRALETSGYQFAPSRVEVHNGTPTTFIMEPPNDQ